jgi:hypothetical protein
MNSTVLKRSLFTLSPLILFVLLILSPVRASAAAKFYISPASQSYKVGDKITASVMVDTGGQAINAAEGTVTYSSDILEYQSVSTGGSVFTFWTQGPTGGNTSVSFGGGLSHPGYNGSSGKVVTITWKAKTNGSATIAINGQKILANDGAGTNIYGGEKGATYIIGLAATPKPGSPVVSSSTHPDQSKWYTSRTVNLAWAKSSNVTGYSYSLDQSPGTDPSSAAVDALAKSYDLTGDGVWYFHIKGKIATGFTGNTHFKIQVDSIGPDKFTVTIENDGSATNPKPKVTFETKDSGSGIEKYEATLDGGAPFAIKSGDTLPKLKPGSHTISVKAFDKAGNVQEATVKFEVEGVNPPVIVDWTTVVRLLDSANFIGQSAADDTIIVYLEGKEVERFKAKDKQVPFSKVTGKQHLFAAEGDIAWEYRYSQILSPGEHPFTFSLINTAGAESAITEQYKVKVVADTIKIGNFIFKTNQVILALLLLILILLLITAIQGMRIHTLLVRCGTGFISGAKRLRALLRNEEKIIMSDIDTTLPNRELKVKQVKKQLKEEIHKTIEDEEQKL